jgi:hypothetical protein
MAIRGGLLAGFGLGIGLAWLLYIFETANPRTTVTDNGVVSAYPSMMLTVLFVLVASSAVGAGLGLLVASVIRDESGRSSSQGSSLTSDERTWFEFIKELSEGPASRD